MHYDPEKNDHGLAGDSFKSCVVPRPIGWISTVSVAGNSLARLGYYDYATVDSAFEMLIPNRVTE
jgi:hypothetical protein